MKLATWNVNSIRQRAPHVRAWLARHQPDVLVVQELKCEAAAFPAETFAAIGYRSEVVGQKSYNGVAALARVPFAVTHRALPGLPEGDAQARYIEITTGGLTLIGIYLPNGNSGAEAGYAYKLGWMEALRARAEALLEADADFAIMGDFNVCPTADDLAPGALDPSDALVRPESRAAFRALLWLGLTDAVRALQPAGPAYTFWDYQAGAWPRDRGLRIDHALLSPRLAERLQSAVIDRAERGMDQPSDHVPVMVELRE
ncbi:MAG: exodeoxyribonuclease III [Rhodospirillales bacterium]|nr:exodeoxyribonuclease III [Rhodospirillales bacterium]MDE2574028.1 exodeoxyribonuclease III [Rhodospirillales bacterium]